ncbi:hypothetical protein HDU97_008805 [Phlyctochytrium planicorne]|nr:hypothetical protein HDU97_008805 [Phlyctochytrium planicorne]
MNLKNLLLSTKGKPWAPSKLKEKAASIQSWLSDVTAKPSSTTHGYNIPSQIESLPSRIESLSESLKEAKELLKECKNLMARTKATNDQLYIYHDPLALYRIISKLKGERATETSYKLYRNTASLSSLIDLAKPVVKSAKKELQALKKHLRAVKRGEASVETCSAASKCDSAVASISSGETIRDSSSTSKENVQQAMPAIQQIPQGVSLSNLATLSQIECSRICLPQRYGMLLVRRSQPTCLEAITEEDETISHVVSPPSHSPSNATEDLYPPEDFESFFLSDRPSSRFGRPSRTIATDTDSDASSIRSSLYADTEPDTSSIRSTLSASTISTTSTTSTFQTRSQNTPPSPTTRTPRPILKGNRLHTPIHRIRFDFDTEPDLSVFNVPLRPLPFHAVVATRVYVAKTRVKQVWRKFCRIFEDECRKSGQVW